VYVYLSKILPNMLMPLSLALLLLVAALLARRSSHRFLRGLVGFALIVLWISATPLVAEFLLGRLEGHYPAVSVRSLPDNQCIILLGGVVGPATGPRVDLDLNASADRVFKVVELFRLGKGHTIFVTAGNQPWSGPVPTEAALIAELLVFFGVPADAIQLEGNSRNTRENVLNVKPLLEAAGCQNPLLVTSAAHMPRAVATFAALEIPVIPVATDFRVANGSRMALMDFFPDAQALVMTSDAIREWMGQKVYEWKGWN
jgi:uncharacterized SAM-binding protein YcdF (DUF218 family)